MGNWDLEHRFHDGVDETASGVQVTENFDQAREKVEALENHASLNAAGVRALFQSFTSVPSILAPSSSFPYTENGISFPTACDFAWLAGWQTFSDVGRTTPLVTAQFSALVVPSGQHVSVTVAAGGELIPVYPRIYIVAIGH